MTTPAGQGAHAMREGRAAAAAYWALAAAVVLPFWMVAHVPTQDGPAHLDTARVMVDLLTSAGSDAARHYRINPELTATWAGPLLLAGLLRFFQPDLAEKLTMSLCVLLLAWTIRCWCRGKTPAVAFLALPLLLNFPLAMGFLSYCLSLPLLVFALHLWFHNDSLSGRLGVAACGLLLLPTHVASYAVLAGVLGLDALAQLTRQQTRGNIWPSVAVMGPAAIVGALSFLGAGGVQGFSAEPAPRISYHPLLLYTPMSIFPAFTITILFLFILLYAVRRRFPPRQWQRSDALLAATIVLAGAFFAVPTERLGSAYLHQRLLLSAFLMAVLWLAEQSFQAPDARVLRIIGAGLLVFQAAVALPPYFQAAEECAAVASLNRYVASGSTLFSLYHQRRGGPLIAPLTHAGGRVALLAGARWLNNYQGGASHFPLRLRQDSPWRKFWSESCELPSGVEPQYVLTVDLPEPQADPCGRALNNDLENRYALVAAALERRVLLYRLRAAPRSSF